MKSIRLFHRHLRLCLIALALTCASTATAQPQNADREEQQRKRELAALTLPDAAKRAGKHYIREWNVGTWAIAPDLTSLSNGSQAVIVGDVVSQQAVLSKDQMYITTIATVRVVEAIKGDAKGSLKVVLVGGRIDFPDGTSAETKPNGGEPLHVGSRYVLFLDPVKETPSDSLAPQATGGYIPKLGPQGIFELRSDGVKAYGRNIDKVKELHEKEPVTAFLQKVRKTASNSKPPALQ